MSNAHKGKSSGMKGKKLSDERKQQISKQMAGSNNPMYGVPSPNKGKHWSEEGKRHLSDVQRGITKPKYKWLTSTGEIKEMDIANAKRFHPDWKLIN